MVLTPKFHFTQTAEHLMVHIVLPNIRISGMEIMVVAQREFSFYCRPYLLRVNLPGTVYDEDEEDKTRRPSAQFLPDTSVLICKLQKTEPGQEFEGLDFITTLLAKPRTANSSGGTGRYGLGEEGQGQYGFLTNFSNFFGVDGFLAEFPDLIDLPNPDFTEPEMRTELKVFHENAMFDFQRYQVDLHMGGLDDLYEQAMEYEPDFGSLKLTEEDNLVLQQLPTASSPSNVAGDVHQRRMYKIADVLLAYCYELRFCTGDFSVESHVMIRKLSSTLSWFQEFQTMQEVCQSFARRCLCFPFLRRWDLCCAAARDCAALLSNRQAVCKSLLTLRKLFQKSQSAYLLNRLFVDDMCVYVQHMGSLDFSQVQQVLAESFGGQRKVPSIELVGWNLAVKRASKRNTSSTNFTTRTAAPEVISTSSERDFIEELD